jgi:GGDEF domain-containing protein
MISLRKFWTDTDKEAEPATLTRVVQLLIQGIALHAVEGDPLDHQMFRREMQTQMDAVEASPTPAELLVSIGAVLQALEGYNSRTTRHMRLQGAELYHMITMLTRTVETLGSGSEHSVGRLREIEGQLEKTSVIEDVRLLKTQLAECLDGIRTEAQRQKAESARAIASMQADIRDSQERISVAGAGPVLDPTTGVPARAAAAAALAELVLSPHPPYAALFVVDRIQLLNSRFGYEVGDRVLKSYLEELRKHLPPGDQIFRWSGPAFLALLNRPDRIEKVREHLRFSLPPKVERNFELSKRSVLLSITATWAVFPVTPPLDEMVERLDTFLGTQNRTVPA